MVSVFILTYGAVFAAEIVGDKLLYTTGVLAARYRALPIVSGATLAFMVKMSVAVLVGETISELPRILVAGLTAAGFVWVAYTVWHKQGSPSEATRPPQAGSRGALVSFVAVLSSEWGDVGQVTAATMAARFDSASAVWLGAVCAMATKGVLAAWLGVGVRRWVRDRVSPRMVRYGTVTLLLLLGTLAAAEAFLSNR
jgi:Ca2+/H+ antiporter, TMEM165/GDT1 family